MYKYKKRIVGNRLARDLGNEIENWGKRCLYIRAERIDWRFRIEESLAKRKSE